MAPTPIKGSLKFPQVGRRQGETGQSSAVTWGRVGSRMIQDGVNARAAMTIKAQGVGQKAQSDRGGAYVP